jgi:hypothetical protein
MGGPGSGNWYRWNTKVTVEGLKAIDVHWLRRRGLLRPGSFVALSWSRNGEPAGSIHVSFEEERVVLNYRRRHGEEAAWEDVREPVPVTWTSCNYGGKRPWFLCPGVVNGRHCGRRVAILYAAGKYFLCRHCYNLSYSSQNENEMDRARRKASKLEARLGDCEWRKPKGMHQRTFDRLRWQLNKANENYSEGLADFLIRLTKGFFNRNR